MSNELLLYTAAVCFESARQVYLKNDLRAELKRRINQIVGSSIMEEKSY